MVEVDGRMVARLKRLLRVAEEIGIIHLVALIMLLRLRRSARPCRKQAMVPVEKSVDGFGIRIIRIGDMEGIAYLIPFDPVRLWLVTNRIDFDRWNELHA